MLAALDLALVHALCVDGRASSTTIANVLGVSVQTVQRRYSKLRETVGLRVTAGIDPAVNGDQQWLLRLTSSTSGAQSVARVLAERPDTSWVRLASGGTEIIAVVTVPSESTATAPRELLLRDIPRTASVTGVAAHQLLHVHRGGPTPWVGRLTALTEAQQHALSARTPPVLPTTIRTLHPDDHRLIRELALDGRSTLRALAARTGLSEAIIARRIDALRADGTLYFDIDLDDTAAHGITDKTFLWLNVPPRHLADTAQALLGHQQLAFIAAITGPTNLVALALTTRPDGLYHYLSHDLAQIDSITHLETAPVLSTLKTVRRSSW